MKITKEDLFEWIKNFYGNDDRFLMEQLTGQDRRLKADENDVDKALSKKLKTKGDAIDYIYNLNEEGQKYLEDNNLVDSL